MGKPKAPKAPDPVATSNAQADANRRTAITEYGLNATNQRTPFGNLEYRQIGTWEDGTPRYESTQTLSPEQQNLYNQQTQLSSGLMGLGQQQLGQLQGRMGTPFSTQGLPSVSQPGFQNFEGGPQLQSSIGDTGPISRSLAGAGDIQRGIGDAGDIQRSYGSDFSADRQRVEDAMMGRLNTQLGRDKSSLEQKLANQGVSRGSEAYNNAMQDFSRGEQEARTSALLSAGQEQSRLANLSRDAAQFQNSAQQQAHQQALSGGQFANTAQQQAYQQALSGGQFANDAQRQAFEQALASGNFGNSANQQMYQNQTGARDANNALAQQQFGNQQTLRNQALQERLMERNQPLNEMAALMGGSQIQMPQFGNTPQAGVAPTDVMGAYNNQYQGQLNAYNQKMQNRQGMMGGLFGLGSAALGGLFG